MAIQNNGGQNMKAILLKAKGIINNQIKVVEGILNQSIIEKDKEQHQKTLDALNEVLKAVESIEVKVSNSGRKKSIDTSRILEMKRQGATQQEIAQILNISIASVTRSYREEREGK